LAGGAGQCCGSHLQIDRRLYKPAHEDADAYSGRDLGTSASPASILSGGPVRPSAKSAHEPKFGAQNNGGRDAVGAAGEPMRGRRAGH
jgi:hypothetical protein